MTRSRAGDRDRCSSNFPGGCNSVLFRIRPDATQTLVRSTLRLARLTVIRFHDEAESDCFMQISDQVARRNQDDKDSERLVRLGAH